MPDYRLPVLGVHVSFKAEADQTRVDQAVTLLEERWARLQSKGSQLSKEKLLIFLALGLADELLLSTEKLSEYDDRIARLLAKIDEA